MTKAEELLQQKIFLEEILLLNMQENLSTFLLQKEEKKNTLKIQNLGVICITLYIRTEITGKLSGFLNASI